MEKALLVDQIEKLFLGDPGDCFSRDDDKKNFHVMLRVAVDFHEYLVAADVQKSDADEIDYMVDTIRSGMDFFFAFKNYYYVWADQISDENRWRFYADFALLKSEYIQLFQRIKNDEVSFDERMRCLFLLVGMELQFVAAKW
jgi:hypothetical protein